ncbi:hypothetical protein MPTK1_3g23450 [Marchantia polymorpha subsp. ruderalis]|uniref:Uncharacterized protein n=2 Tax=Marchantia polymorpha TaxID=3197 RepID=A0AAF6B3Z2_MARPO|nr:hypothetical protein MARPO_0024s0121 [Marchantia polymorpha]BBN06726.1 hypothetical protein Mp_3g23450 [Marchantia polymorpha subsp. ruderalis]|eukprot:PTQ43625.1 hypothetical protein MARPO_0024s0121 [Marchantia polymorpha]
MSTIKAAPEEPHGTKTHRRTFQDSFLTSSDFNRTQEVNPGGEDCRGRFSQSPHGISQLKQVILRAATSLELTEVRRNSPGLLGVHWVRKTSPIPLSTSICMFQL